MGDDAKFGQVILQLTNFAESLDAIKHVPFDWLTDLRTALNAEFPMPTGGRFYLVGETYDYGNQGVLAAYINPQTMLDGQFDFPLRLKLCESFLTGSQDLNSLFSWMSGNDAFYPAGALMSTWIGNHDIPRAIHFANGGYFAVLDRNVAYEWRAARAIDNGCLLDQVVVHLMSPPS